MYCPNCNKEYNGKFCPECGTKLIEKPSANGFTIDGSGNAIDMHTTNQTITHDNRVSHDSHNDNSQHYDQRGMIQAGTYYAAQTTEQDVVLKKEERYRAACRRVYEDFVIDDVEIKQLKGLAQDLGLSDDRALSILNGVKQQMDAERAREEALNPRAQKRLQRLLSSMRENDVDAVTEQLESFDEMVTEKSISELHFVYYLAQAALNHKKCIALAEKSMTDSYWRSYWSYVAYIKNGNKKEATSILDRIETKFSDYSADNTALLASVGELMLGNRKAADNEFLDIDESKLSPRLQRLFEAMLLILDPTEAKENNLREKDYLFYLKHIFNCETTEEREKREREERKAREAEERRLKAEAERIRKAEEAKRKAEEEHLSKEAEAKRKREEEERRRAEEQKRREEEARRRAAEIEAKHKAEEEARRKAVEDAKRKEEEERKRKEAEAKQRREEEYRKRMEEARAKAEQEAKRRAEEDAKQKKIKDVENAQYNRLMALKDKFYSLGAITKKGLEDVFNKDLSPKTTVKVSTGFLKSIKVTCSFRKCPLTRKEWYSYKIGSGIESVLFHAQTDFLDPKSLDPKAIKQKDVDEIEKKVNRFSELCSNGTINEPITLTETGFYSYGQFDDITKIKGKLWGLPFKEMVPVLKNAGIFSYAYHDLSFKELAKPAVSGDYTYIDSYKLIGLKTIPHEKPVCFDSNIYLVLWDVWVS